MGRLPYLRLVTAIAALALSPMCTCDEPDPLSPRVAAEPTEPPVVEITRAPTPVAPSDPPEVAAAEPEPEPASEPETAPEPETEVVVVPEPAPVAEPPAPAPVAPESEEVEFAWHQPRDGVFTPFANIHVTGEAQPGTWLKIRNGPEVEVTGRTFSIPLTLEEGTNRIHLIVTEVGRRTIQHRRKITFVDLDRIQRIRERISAQRKTVDELEQIRADLVTTIADIRSVLPSLPTDVAGEVGALVDELDMELGNLGEASEGLDGDIDRELAQIDDLKGRVQELTE